MKTDTEENNDGPESPPEARGGVRRLIAQGRRAGIVLCAIGFLIVIVSVVLLAQQKVDAGLNVFFYGGACMLLGLMFWIAAFVRNVPIALRDEAAGLQVNQPWENTLPSSEPLDRTTIRPLSVRTARRGWGCAVVGIVLLLVGLAAGVAERWDLVYLSAVGALVGLVMGGLLLYHGRRLRDQLKTLLAGKHLLVHWTLDADEWRSYANTRREKGMKNTRMAALVGGVLGALAAGCFLLVDISVGVPWSAYFLTVAAASFGFALVFFVIGYAWVQATYSALLHDRGEVFLGYEGAYFAGGYDSWSDGRMRKVTFTRGHPATINVHADFQGGRRTVRNVYRIPVPRTHERDFKAIASALL